MADKTTYIKLDRNIINWRWFQTPKILSVFIWLIIKANIKEGHFRNDVIPRGSLVTSNAHIAEGCGITIANARVALANLESTGEISRESRNHYQIIKINNYEMYQSAIAKQTEQIASKSQANSKQIATIKEYKNNKNGKKEKESLRSESPNGEPIRGTDEFRRKSHLLLKPEEGTIDDIPTMYRDDYKNFADYWRYKNQ